MTKVAFSTFLALLIASSNCVVRNPVLGQNNIDPDCILLSQCPELLWLLKNKHSVPGMGFQQVLRYLQNQQCGYEGNHPKVICPKPEDLLEEEVPIQNDNFARMSLSSHSEELKNGMRMGGVIDTPGGIKTRL